MSQEIQRQFPSFRSKNYGYRKITSLLGVLTEDFETISSKDGVFTRIKVIKKENFVEANLRKGLFQHSYDIGYCVQDEISSDKFQCRANESTTREEMKSLVERMRQGEEVKVLYRASRKDGQNIALEIRPI